MKRVFLIFSISVAVFGSEARTGEYSDPVRFPLSRVVRSTHFAVHHEDPLAPAGVLNVLEGLHGKILLDLGIFSPWAYDQPISVYLYHDASSYSTATGMAPYVKAHIRVETKEVFGYMTPDFQRTMAHELGHLYFSQFFLAKSTAPPLWLNEGVASLMEWDYGLERDRKDADRYLKSVGTIPFDEFLNYSYQHARPEDGEKVGVWYIQAQSVTRFLLRNHSPAQFYRLCDGLRQGRTLDQSLQSAYGLAMGDAAALERSWIGTFQAP